MVHILLLATAAITPAHRVPCLFTLSLVYRGVGSESLLLISHDD